MHHLDRSDPAFYHSQQDDARYPVIAKKGGKKKDFGDYYHSYFDDGIPKPIPTFYPYKSIAKDILITRDPDLYDYYYGSQNSLICSYRITQKNIDDPYYCWWEDHNHYNAILNLFKPYLKDVNDAIIVLTRPNPNYDKETNSKPEQRLFLDYKTRYSKHYKNKALERIDKIIFNTGSLITLTTDPNLFYNMLDAVKSLKSNLNKLLSNLRHKYPNLTYFWVMEFGSKNYLPHIHLMIKDKVITEEDKRWITKLWKHQARITDIRPIRNIYASSYVKKYLKKGLIPTDKDEDNIKIALFWTTGTRTYGYSKNLITPINKPLSKTDRDLKDVKWSYLGTISITTAQTLLNYNPDILYYGSILDIPDPPPN